MSNVVPTLPDIEHLLTAAATRRAYEFALPRTVAIFTNVRQCPTFVGSGVFVEMGGQVFLISASHVIQDLKDGAYVSRLSFESIGPTGVRTNFQPDDPLDIAFWKVDAELASRVGATVVPESRLLLEQFLDPFICFSGFPASRNKPGKAIRVNDKKMTSFCFVYAGVEAEVDYMIYGKSPEFHLALTYTEGRNEKGVRAKPPSPRGMSGGPIWCAKDISCASNPFLAGIFTEFHEKKGKVAFGTKIEFVVSLIRKAFEV